MLLHLDEYERQCFGSLIFGSEVVKVKGAGLMVSQVSGETHATATDTPGVCARKEEREQRSELEKTLKRYKQKR